MNRPAPTSSRRTQEERSAATQRRVLEATIQCLIRDGYAACSTSAIQHEAGVSRGALTHQFRSKQELLIAAVAHLAKTRAEAARVAVTQLPAGEERLRAVIELMWQEFDSDLFRAALELWTAARTDGVLHAALYPAERVLGAQHRNWVAELVGPEVAADPNFGRAFDGLINYLRGTALTDILRGQHSDPHRVTSAGTTVFRSLLTPDKGAPPP